MKLVQWVLREYKGRPVPQGGQQVLKEKPDQLDLKEKLVKLVKLVKLEQQGLKEYKEKLGIQEQQVLKEKQEKQGQQERKE